MPSYYIKPMYIFKGLMSATLNLALGCNGGHKNQDVMVVTLPGCNGGHTIMLYSFFFTYQINNIVCNTL